MIVVMLVVVSGVGCWTCCCRGHGVASRVARVAGVVLIAQALSDPSLLLGLEGGPWGRGRLRPGRHNALTGGRSGGDRVVQRQVGLTLLYLGVVGVSG